MRFRVSIDSNLVCITCELERYDPSHLGQMLGRASLLAGSFLDLISFSQGIALTLSLDTLILPDDKVAPLVNNPQGLAHLCKAFSLSGESYFDVLTMVMAEPSLATALDDLIAGIGSHRQAQINCARAIEGVRGMMNSADTSRPRA